MSRELSEQARAMLERALAEERPRLPGATRRAQLNRNLLGGAVLAAAGRAAAAPVIQLAAPGAVVPGTGGVASLLTFGKGLVVGLLVSGGIVGGTQYLTSAPAKVTPSVALAASRAAPVEPTAPVVSARVASDVLLLPAEKPAVSATTPTRSPGEGLPAEPAPGLSAELSLLTATQAALRDGRGAEALSLIDSYDRKFPGGQLLGERLAAEVFAACQVGDRARATRAAQRFSQRDSSSVLAGRVRRSCAFERAEGEP